MPMYAHNNLTTFFVVVAIIYIFKQILNYNLITLKCTKLHHFVSFPGNTPSTDSRLRRLMTFCYFQTLE